MRVVKRKKLANEVTQTDYEIEVNSSTVPFVVWTPNSDVADRTVLIAMAHGGSQHKKTEDIRLRAIRYATDYSWVSFSLDAPGHGDRVSREETLKNMRDTEARVRGKPGAPSMTVTEKILYLDNLATQAVPEWKAVLDNILNATLVSNRVEIGYWGLSMGSSIGIPLLATDSRYRCAVLGLSELLPNHKSFATDANSIDIPIRFIFQWDDPIRKRENGISLFEAFASDDKSMHINPGGHIDYPKSEADSWDRFFERWLVG